MGTLLVIFLVCAPTLVGMVTGRSIARSCLNRYPDLYEDTMVITFACTSICGLYGLVLGGVLANAVK